MLLLVLLIGGSLVLGSLNLAGTATTSSSKQCPDFDEQREALRLAQVAERYRQQKPAPKNYGLGSATLCLTTGEIQSFQTPVIPGYSDLDLDPVHIMHSEQQTYRLLQNQLAVFASRTKNIVSIFVVIFSQVTVCGKCEPDMVSWQSTLRQKAGVQQLFLIIWDLLRGKGFSPQKKPAGSGTSVTLADIRLVPVQFSS